PPVCALPCGVTSPRRVAYVAATEVPLPAVTPAAAAPAAGVKVASAPLLVPPVLVASRRKWYSLPVWRPETGTETVTGLVPEPAFCVDVFEPYFVLVPYSKYQVVASPFGLTVPFSVAEVGPIAL